MKTALFIALLLNTFMAGLGIGAMCAAIMSQRYGPAPYQAPRAFFVASMIGTLAAVLAAVILLA